MILLNGKDHGKEQGIAGEQYFFPFLFAFKLVGPYSKPNLSVLLHNREMVMPLQQRFINKLFYGWWYCTLVRKKKKAFSIYHFQYFIIYKTYSFLYALTSVKLEPKLELMKYCSLIGCIFVLYEWEIKQ